MYTYSHVNANDLTRLAIMYKKKCCHWIISEADLWRNTSNCLEISSMLNLYVLKCSDHIGCHGRPNDSVPLWGVII